MKLSTLYVFKMQSDICKNCIFIKVNAVQCSKFFSTCKCFFLKKKVCINHIYLGTDCLATKTLKLVSSSFLSSACSWGSTFKRWNVWGSPYQSIKKPSYCLQNQMKTWWSYEFIRGKRWSCQVKILPWNFMILSSECW